MKVTASLCIFASLLLTITEAALPGNWPPVDKAPPPVAEWTALVDQAKVAKAPTVKTADDVGKTCPDKDPFCNWSCTGCTRQDSDVVNCPTKGDWGITFDDGPTEFTDGLLDFLAKTNTKVTFFVVGSRVFENPDILKKAVNAGHQIGVHTWSHPSLTTQSNEQIIAEIKWTESAIKAAVGLTPKYMRPPFGDYDDRVRNIATQLGYKVVIWDKDTNDWMSADDKTFQLTWIEGNFTEWVKEPQTVGHISLEHDLYKQTAERAQLALPIVQNAGFLVKPVSVCLADPKPYVEDVTLDAGGSASTSTPAAAPATADPAPAPAKAQADPVAYPSAVPSATPSPYLVGNSDSSSSSGYSSGYSSSAASLNSINLLSFVSLIVGSFMFI